MNDIFTVEVVLCVSEYVRVCVYIVCWGGDEAMIAMINKVVVITITTDHA